MSPQYTDEKISLVFSFVFVNFLVVIFICGVKKIQKVRATWSRIGSRLVFIFPRLSSLRQDFNSHEGMVILPLKGIKN